MPATRIQFQLANQSTSVLVKPTLGEDFIAGMNLATGRWCIVPSVQLRSLEFRSLVAELDYPINMLALKLDKYLEALISQSLLIFEAESARTVKLGRIHGCFALACDLTGDRSEVIVNLAQVSRIEVLLVENSSTEAQVSGKVAAIDIAGGSQSVNHR